MKEAPPVVFLVIVVPESVMEIPPKQQALSSGKAITDDVCYCRMPMTGLHFYMKSNDIRKPDS